MNPLSQIEAQVAVCDQCRLRNTVINRVFGEGDSSASVMIIGESPGREENSAGRPFVGDAGQLLQKAFDKLSVRREDFYISNILKCWIPSNKITTDIKLECIPKCVKFIEAQIEAIQPKVIFALGSTAMQVLVDIHSSIGKMRGKVLAGPHEVLVVSTWHPAYILRCGGMGGDKTKQRRAAKEFISDFRCALDVAGMPYTETK
jgi:uracil-DNA glycosylase family 4